jgi:hypothetical protein
MLDSQLRAASEEAHGRADIFKAERLADADLCIIKPSINEASTSEAAAKRQRTPQEPAIKFPVHLVLLRKCPFFDSGEPTVYCTSNACKWSDKINDSLWHSSS